MLTFNRAILLKELYLIIMLYLALQRGCMNCMNWLKSISY